MKILFIAPQPFYQERGTPIAVKLALGVIGKKHSVDLISYAEGEDISLPIQNHYRVCSSNCLKKVRPGFSCKKFIIDIFLFFKVLKLVRKNKYELLHCVEESVFIGLAMKYLYKIPYIYDMDSSLSLQILERFQYLNFMKGFFEYFEKVATRNSLAVIAVCDALVHLAKKFESKKTYLLSDISLLEHNQDNKEIDLKSEISISPDSVIGLYIGNLEKYQGVELLVESFNLVNNDKFHLVIIGGTQEDINKIANTVNNNKKSNIHFLGSRPVSQLKAHLSQADILFSPRIQGNNTPMKIYSYLHAGKALVATNLSTHTQVLNSEISYLTAANPKQMSEAIDKLVDDSNLRNNLGLKARKFAEENYTFDVFKNKLEAIYLEIEQELS